jgi:putative transposase
MAIKKNTLDDLLAGRDPRAVFSKDGLFDELKKALAERVLNAEIDDHLDGEAAAGKRNSRNGYSKKTVLTESSKLDLRIPRDREGTFDPKLIARYQRRFPGFDDKIVSMYARGMTVREIQGHLMDLYGLEVSPDLISTVTDAVLETVAEWQNRPLDEMYPLVFFDALRVKIRDEGLVRNKAVYIALGVTPDGTKDILGLWIETSEGAKFWLRVMNELKNRGVGDILIAVVDGLKGFPDAISAVFPQTIVQTCIVHLIRNSMDFASWKDRKAIAAELKAIYRATDADVGRKALEDFDADAWGRKYPAIAQSWRRNWEHVIPFFAFPIAVRRIIYTTNAIEALNAKLRRAVRTRGHWACQEFRVRAAFFISGLHGLCEALAEDDGELRLGHRPFTRRHLPLLFGAVQDEKEQLHRRLVGGEVPSGADGAP